jgi:hypothetical protein
MIDLCCWSEEKSDTGNGVICNIERSNASYLVGIFSNGFETETSFVPFVDRISSTLQCDKCKGKSKGRRIAVSIFKLSNRWRWVVIMTIWRLHLVPIELEAGWTPTRRENLLEFISSNFFSKHTLKHDVIEVNISVSNPREPLVSPSIRTEILSPYLLE